MASAARQRQRGHCAALLLDPRILILDDSTSAVDAETEYQIQQALDKLMVGRTSFVIAQRISTVRSADLVLCWTKARSAVWAPTKSFMMDSPSYAKIVQSQLREDKPVPIDNETADGLKADSVTVAVKQSRSQWGSEWCGGRSCGRRKR
ncbi:MAG: hypothetical protein R2867_44845 [Caldilineaceae bacterium]